MIFLYPNRHYVVSLALLIAVSVFTRLFTEWLGTVNIPLMFLIPVIAVALRGDMRATTIVTTLTVMTFDMLYAAPYFSLDVHDVTYIWSFVLFFLVGYTVTYQAKRIQSNTVKEILLKTLSHDLKTPLSSIMGNAMFLLKDQNINPQTRHDVLVQIEDSSQRMNRLIANLLDSARLKEGRNTLQKEWCDLEDLVGVAQHEFRYESIRRAIEVKIDPDLTLFWGDCGLLVRLMVNLMDNAFKYSHGSKHIRLNISSTSKEVTILFFNESLPIKKADLKNMFNKFYRLEKTADIRGSGIGLSICNDIVRAHHGSIEAYNVKDGLCIEVRLPIIKHPSINTKESL